MFFIDNNDPDNLSVGRVGGGEEEEEEFARFLSRLTMNAKCLGYQLFFISCHICFKGSEIKFFVCQLFMKPSGFRWLLLNNTTSLPTGIFRKKNFGIII